MVSPVSLVAGVASRIATVAENKKLTQQLKQAQEAARKLAVKNPTKELLMPTVAAAGTGIALYCSSSS
jgi:GAF domain-containing protein